MYTLADYHLYQQIDHLAFAIRLHCQHSAPVSFTLAALHEDLKRWLASGERNYLVGLNLRENALTVLEGDNR